MVRPERQGGEPSSCSRAVRRRTRRPERPSILSRRKRGRTRRPRTSTSLTRFGFHPRVHGRATSERGGIRPLRAVPIALGIAFSSWRRKWHTTTSGRNLELAIDRSSLRCRRVVRTPRQPSTFHIVECGRILRARRCVRGCEGPCRRTGIHVDIDPHTVGRGLRQSRTPSTGGLDSVDRTWQSSTRTTVGATPSRRRTAKRAQCGRISTFETEPATRQEGS
ncbi:hypothetical protein STSO111631_12680 [Stackebrandtia soli]